MTLFVPAVGVQLGLSEVPGRRVVARRVDRSSEAADVVGEMCFVVVERRCGHPFRCSDRTW